MTPYIVLFLFVIFTQLLYGRVCLSGNVERIHKLDNRLFFWYSLIVCLMLGTRLQTVGTDTETYVQFFQHPKFFYGGRATDWGFEQLGRFFHLFGSSAEWFIFWSGFLSMVGVIYLIKNCAQHKSTSMMFFVFTGTTFIFFQLYFSMVRQATALTFYIIAVCLLFEKKKLILKLGGAVIFFVIAYLVHGSTLFGLPFVLFAYFVPLTNKRIWYILIWAGYGLAILDISYVNTFLDFVFDLLGQNKYDKYVDVSIGQVEYTGNIINMILLPYSMTMTALIYMCDHYILKKWWMQLSLMGAVMTNFFYNNLMWGRLLLPLIIFSIVATPNVLERTRKNLRLPMYFAILAYFLYKNMRELSDCIAHGYLYNINTNVPYDSWLFDFFNF